MNPSATSSAETSSQLFSPYLVETHALNIQFGAQEVIRDVTLQIRHGQTVAIIGESGCGKTVLLKSLVGLLQPTSGFVPFDQQDLGA